MNNLCSKRKRFASTHNRLVFTWICVSILKELSRDQPCDITGIRDYQMIDNAGGIQCPLPDTSNDAAASKDEPAPGLTISLSLPSATEISTRWPCADNQDAHYPASIFLAKIWLFLPEFDCITLVVSSVFSTAVARWSNRVRQILAYAFILELPLHMQSYSQLALRENRQ
jgi:hypothetical protein